ncbi:MAG: DNA polymerase III subunit beta [Peptococcaceae bacterium]|nr:MAG: DNA polymerase III subunit beta [Peptococcaceae bacterium]
MEVLMKCEIQVAAMQRAVATVSPAVARRSTLPVLSNVLIRADKTTGITVQATDLEIGLSTWEVATVESEGAACVPYQTFNDWLKEMDKADVLTLAGDEDSLQAVCGKFTADFRSIPADEFPLISGSHNKIAAIELDPADLIKLVGRVVFAASTDESRPVLKGICLDFDAAGLTGVAVDGFRLSKMSINGFDAPAQRLIIPADTMSVLGKIAARIGDTVLVYFPEPGAPAQATFNIGNVDLVSHQLQGSFPDYNNIIPTSPTKLMTLPVDRLAHAVRAALVFARDSANIIKISISGETMSIKAASAETGDFEADLPVAFTTDEPDLIFSFGLNAVFMSQALAAMPPGQVIIEAKEPGYPFLFRPEGDGEEFVHVIMPMHVN